MTNAFPSISVILCVYKETPAVLRRSIDSILNQTFRDYELIFMVDNPDNSEAIALIREYMKDDERLVLHINEKNIGTSASRNTGVKIARGEYIAIQDGDDKSMPKRLERQHAYFVRHPDIGVLGSAIQYTDNASDQCLFVRHYPKLVGSEINRYNPLASSSVMMKRSLFESHGYFRVDPSAREGIAEDYTLWVKWYLQGVRMANLDDVLMHYYQSAANGMSRVPKKTLRNTIQLKINSCRKLRFSFLDYMYLLTEIFLFMLPASVIYKLFFLYYRRMRKMG